MNTSTKNTWRQILSVLAGIGTAIAIAIPVAFLGVLMGVSDGKNEQSRLPFAAAVIIVGVVVGVFMAGYITALISGSGKWWPMIVTGAILVLLFIINAGETVANFDPIQLGVLIAIFPLTCLGGWWGIRKQDN